MINLSVLIDCDDFSYFRYDKDSKIRSIWFLNSTSIRFKDYEYENIIWGDFELILSYVF